MGKFAADASAGGARDAGVVPVDTLRQFEPFVAALGADVAALLLEAGVNPAWLTRKNGVLSLPVAARLLNIAAARLGRPDLGLQLANFQRGARTGNLFERVMRNAPTVGEGLVWCARHVQTYSGAISVSLDSVGQGRRRFLRYEILVPMQVDQRQAVELMLLRMFHIVVDMSGGRVVPDEVWFCHEPAAERCVYRQQFGGTIRFGRATSGFFLDDADLALPTVDPDPQIHEIAAYYIEHRFPALALPTTTRVKALIARLLHSSDECNCDEIASRLGLHRRTLQRRLQEEGTCFETMKDDVRRKLALHCLGDRKIPLGRVAEMLGYAEASALSRSCNRWFSASPRQLRKELC
jgi:AraC-like DNA-binding protein